MNKPSLLIRLAGLLLISAGVVSNKSVVQQFVPDGQIQGWVLNSIIILFEIACITVGIYLVRRPCIASLLNLALAAFSLVVMFVVGELAARVVVFGPQGLSYSNMRSMHAIVNSGNVQPSQVPGLPYELKPNLDTVFAMAPFFTNSMGMHDQEVSPNPAENEIRIAVIGDSFAAPSGIAWQDAWHTILEGKAEQQFRDYEWQFLNFGVYGYDLPQYVAVIREKALPLKPRMLLIAFCAENDYLPPNPHANYDMTYQNGFFMPVLLKLILYLQYASFAQLDRTPTPEQEAFIASQFAEIGALAKAGDIPVVVAYLATVPRAGEVIGRLATDAGFGFVDVAETFRDTALLDYTLFHPIDGHPNVKANAKFADEIYDYLVDERFMDRLIEAWPRGSM